MSKTTALHVHHAFLVHFFDVRCATTTWNLLMPRSMKDVNIQRLIFLFLFLNLDKVLKNSTSGKIAYIWQIEQVQRDATKFERMQIRLFSNVFTAVVIVAKALYSYSEKLRVTHVYRRARLKRSPSCHLWFESHCSCQKSLWFSRCLILLFVIILCLI